MKLVLVSGYSGSGKSVALKALEDAGYFAVDNLPASLVEPLLVETCHDGERNRGSLDAKDGGGARFGLQPVETLKILFGWTLQVHDQAQCLARAHRRLAEYGLDVEHTDTANFQEVAQQRRATALNGFRPDLVELNCVVSHQAGTA